MRASGKECDGSAEQVDACGEVVRPQDAHARLSEARAGRGRQLVGVLAELSPVQHRLLEVVADEGVVA